EILVDSEISSRVMPRISRSRRSLSPNAPMAKLDAPVDRRSAPMIGSRDRKCQIKRLRKPLADNEFHGTFVLLLPGFWAIHRLLISQNRAIIRASSCFSHASAYTRI